MIKRNIGKKIVIGILCFILFIVVIALVLFSNELKSLASLKVIDNYPMYEMTYYGDYGFDEFLKVGAKSDRDIEKFVTKRLLKGIPININVTGAGCTAFVTKDDKGDTIFARNFDFTYSPSLQLWTKPKNGYASVSTVNLSFAGYSKDNLPTPTKINSFLTLAAPYLPFDGMNEKGVSIALLAVPEVHMGKDKNKVTLNTTTAIRLVLDKAATVTEAVELLRKYNIYFSGNVKCHYLIADATGKSVIVEYWDGGLQVVKADKSYQIASNFIAYNRLNIGEGYSEFDRYNAAKNVIEENNGKLTRDQTIDLLAQIGVHGSNGEDKLQWSVVYNLTDLKGYNFVHRNKKNVKEFSIKK
ncbi:choloylglycine hydrolase [Clostridium carboxidivorans P7]|uniref:Choloylglycine hydrolase n=1 Tax=Clostridium carboxidivorans P7 TaxID=536227 RepID=C6PU30_9CLOT|nr:C45 family peptidase [Clostridium carboxidivorans]AKN33850.1 choloylglycine hydrolase [Clostridium carboxidivorans P7]EET87230.1 Choloylglycine hydrolase [Clostridium carboxidivorans P7]EFG86536.1 acyl-coenzyme A:6-aminopenicillanic acid acyl-transferase [Clostridium carboxidivorans P7]